MVLDLDLFREDKGGDPERVRSTVRARFADVKDVDRVIEYGKVYGYYVIYVISSFIASCHSQFLCHHYSTASDCFFYMLFVMITGTSRPHKCYVCRQVQVAVNICSSF